jgi:hypothetical protein
MKKYRVNLYYHGCISVEVSAENEESALEQAEEIADKMTDEEFMSEAELLGNGTDVYEL